MSSYKHPVKGKLGIRSGVSKRMCFGICCDSKKECREELQNHVGYYDSLKYRFHISEWSDNDLQEHQKYLEEKIEQKKEKQKEFAYRKECGEWVNEHKYFLKDEWLDKFENLIFQNIKVRKHVLEQWLQNPNRIKGD